MKIERIHVHQALLPVVGGAYTMSHTSVGTLDSTLVEVVTDDGLTGWGETPARWGDAGSLTPVATHGG